MGVPTGAVSLYLARRIVQIMDWHENLMRHIPPKSGGRHNCHTPWSFHLKCGEDHDGYRQIHGVPKGSFGSHLGLHDPIHVRHYVFDDQHFEFLGDVHPAIALAGLGEYENSHYAFLVAYQDAKMSEH